MEEEARFIEMHASSFGEGDALPLNLLQWFFQNLNSPFRLGPIRPGNRRSIVIGIKLWLRGLLLLSVMCVVTAAGGSSSIVTIVGSVNADVYVPVSRWPEDGENIVADESEMSGVTLAGGKGAIQAVACSMMMANTPCLLYTSPSPRDLSTSRMPSSA